MKKTMIIASALVFTMTSAMAATTKTTTATATKEVKKNCPKCEKSIPDCKCNKDGKMKFDPKQRQEEFDKRLNLTEEQKVKAKTIREKGHNEMKPLMEKMKANHESFKAIQEDTKLSDKQKEQKIAKLKEEKIALKKQVREARQKNMQEFEAILTPDQQKELATMKEEGKKNFEGKKGCPVSPKGGKPGMHPGPVVPKESKK